MYGADLLDGPADLTTLGIDRVRSQSRDPRFSPRYSKSSPGVEGRKLAAGEYETPTVDIIHRDNLIDVPEMSIADLEGEGFVTSLYDNTRGEGTIVGLGGEELSTPIEMQGGNEFSLWHHGAAGASNKGPVKQVLNRAREIKEQTGRDPLFITAGMAPSGGDFSTMPGEVMIARSMDVLSKNQLEGLSKDIRNLQGERTRTKKDSSGNKIIGPDGEPVKEKYIADIGIKDWPGFNDPQKAIAAWENATGNQRKAVAEKVLDRARGETGVSLTDARLAVTHPDRLNPGLLEVHPIVSRLDLSQNPYRSGHRSYPWAFAGTPIGRLKEGEFSLMDIFDDLLQKQDPARAAMAPRGGIFNDPIMQRLSGGSGVGSATSAFRTPARTPGVDRTGYHYSKRDEPLRRLDPNAYATGASKRAGDELQRLKENPDIAPRTFFYEEGSFPQRDRQTPRPEGVVGGGPTYRAKLTNLYDLEDNPLKLSGSATDIERQIKDKGYSGYRRKGVAVNFEPTEVERIGGFRAEAEENLERFNRLRDEPDIVTAEAVPSKMTQMGQWLSENPDLAERYTDDIWNLIERDRTMRNLGIDDYFIRPGYGSYLNEVNPNLLFETNNPQDAQAIADTIGYATQQDVTPYFNRRGGEGPLGVNLTSQDTIPPDLLKRLNTETGLDATRTMLDSVDIINFDGLPDEEFIDIIDRFTQRAGIGDAREYRANAVYNKTAPLWQDKEGLSRLSARQREAAGQLRRRVEEYNQRFRRQHGSADPRALAAIAALSGIGLYAASEDE
jgi:hypothetical protein